MEYSNIWSGKKVHAIYSPDSGWEIVKSQPLIEATSTAVQYAQVVIEGMKAYKCDGQIIVYRFDDHYQRLLFSLNRLNLPKIDKNFFLKCIESIMAPKSQWEGTIKSDVLYIRPIFYGLEGGVFPVASKVCGFSLYVAPIKKNLKENCSIRFYETITRTSQNGLNNAKASLNYVSIISKPSNDSTFVDIWYDPLTGYIEEADTANIFFVLKNREVITPSVNNRILSGITRDSIVRIIEEVELFSVLERDISVDEVKSFCKKNIIQGCFMTSTGIGIQQVNNICFDKSKYVIENSNEIAENLRKKYLNIIYGNCEKYKSWRTIIKT